MGCLLFCSKTVITTQTFSTRLFNDDTNKLIKSLRTKAILASNKTKRSKTEELIVSTLSYASNFNNFFTYSKAKYIEGLPTTNLGSLFIKHSSITSAILDDLGVNVTILSAKEAIPDRFEYCYWKLQSSNNYLPYNNTLTFNGFSDYVIDSITEDLVEYTINISRFDGTNTITDVILKPLAPEGFFAISTYYEVSVNIWFYWLYDISTGIYPLVRNTQNEISGTPIYPIILLRENSVNVNSDKTSIRYKTTKYALDRLKLDVDLLLDDLNSNPDISDVVDAYVSLGINPSDTNSSVSVSLYNMMDYLYYHTHLSSSTTTDENGDPIDFEVFDVTFTEQSINIALSWESHTKVIVSGTLGKIGVCTHSVVSTDLVVRKQITQAEYIEYTFVNLKSETGIDKGSNAATATVMVGDSSFFIPLAPFSLDTLSPVEKIDLFPYVLRLGVYGATLTKLKWYQTSIFGAVLQVVSIAVYVYLTFKGVDTSSAYAVSQAIFSGLLYSKGVDLILDALDIDNELIKFAAKIAIMKFSSDAGLADFFQNELLSAETLLEASSVFFQSVDSYSKKEYNEIVRKSSTDQKKVKTAFDEIKKENEKSSTFLDVWDVSTLQSIETQMYIAKEAQFDFSSLFDYDSSIYNYYDNKLQLGIV